MRILDEMPDVEKTSLFGRAVHAMLPREIADRVSLSSRLRDAGVDVISEARVEPSLEDVFLDVVERSEREETRQAGEAVR